MPNAIRYGRVSEYMYMEMNWTYSILFISLSLSVNLGYVLKMYNCHYFRKADDFFVSSIQSEYRE